MNEEIVVQQGVHVRLKWHGTDDLPPRHQTTQAAGVCFHQGRVLLVGTGKQWGLAGGHPEPGESLEEALRREVWEEAAILLGKCEPIGYLDIYYPGGDAEGNERFYQSRWWARVERIKPFRPNPETSARRFVPPEDFLSTLFYGHRTNAGWVWDAAFQRELREQRRAASE